MALPPNNSRDPPPLFDLPPPISGDTTFVGSVTGSTAVAIGRGASVIVQQAISHAEEYRQLEQWEQEKLALAVTSLAQGLAGRVAIEAHSANAALGFLQPYELAEVEHFFGRDRARAELLKAIGESRFVVLSGVAGSGKTSLLRAGIIPELIASQYLPIEVRAEGAPLAEAIKAVLLPELEHTPVLQTESLQGFLAQVAHLLPHGREVVVILDQMEIFFDTVDEAARLAFVQEVGRCINVSAPDVRWIVCVRSSHLPRMLEFSPHISQPLAHRLILAGMDIAEAQAAVDGMARLRQVSVQNQATEVLLADLRDDSSDGLILPWKLQLICHKLIGDQPPYTSELSLERYRQLGGVEVGMCDYLEQYMKESLDRTDRIIAMEALVTLTEHRHQRADKEAILARLRNYDVNASKAEHVLRLLENSFLVNQSDNVYQIGSMSFLPHIHNWSITQRVDTQVRAEVKRQIDNFRGSALRGLFGGAIGFGLTYLVIDWSLNQDFVVLPYLTMMRAMIGGLVGLLFVLFVDMASASYRGAHRAMRWFSGGTAGALSFGFGLMFHALLRRPIPSADDTMIKIVNSIVLPLFLAGLEGVLWGAAAGLGTAWALSVKHSCWLPFAATAAASGLTLWLAESVGHAFCRPMFGQACALQASPGLLIVAGMLLPTCLIAAALLGRGDLQQLPEEHHRPTSAP